MNCLIHVVDMSHEISSLCYEYSKEPSQLDSSFELPKYILIICFDALYPSQ